MTIFGKVEMIKKMLGENIFSPGEEKEKREYEKFLLGLIKTADSLEGEELFKFFDFIKELITKKNKKIVKFVVIATENFEESDEEIIHNFSKRLKEKKNSGKSIEIKSDSELEPETYLLQEALKTLVASKAEDNKVAYASVSCTFEAEPQNCECENCGKTEEKVDPQDEKTLEDLFSFLIK